MLGTSFQWARTNQFSGIKASDDCHRYHGAPSFFGRWCHSVTTTVVHFSTFGHGDLCDIFCPYTAHIAFPILILWEFGELENFNVTHNCTSFCVMLVPFSISFTSDHRLRSLHSHNHSNKQNLKKSYVFFHFKTPSIGAKILHSRSNLQILSFEVKSHSALRPL